MWALHFYLIAFCFRFVLRELYPLSSSLVPPVEFLMSFRRKNKVVILLLLQTELETCATENLQKIWNLLFSDFLAMINRYFKLCLFGENLAVRLCKTADFKCYCSQKYNQDNQVLERYIKKYVTIASSQKYGYNYVRLIFKNNCKISAVFLLKKVQRI